MMIKLLVKWFWNRQEDEVDLIFKNQAFIQFIESLLIVVTLQFAYNWIMKRISSKRKLLEETNKNVNHVHSLHHLEQAHTNSIESTASTMTNSNLHSLTDKKLSCERDEFKQQSSQFPLNSPLLSEENDHGEEESCIISSHGDTSSLSRVSITPSSIASLNHQQESDYRHQSPLKNVNRLTCSLDAIEQERLSLKDTIVLLKTTNKKLETQVRHLSKKKFALQDSIKTLKRDLWAEKQARFVVENTLNEKVKKLEMELDFKETELDELQHRIQDKKKTQSLLFNGDGSEDDDDWLYEIPSNQIPSSRFQDMLSIQTNSTLHLDDPSPTTPTIDIFSSSEPQFITNSSSTASSYPPTTNFLLNPPLLIISEDTRLNPTSSTSPVNLSPVNLNISTNLHHLQEFWHEAKKHVYHHYVCNVSPASIIVDLDDLMLKHNVTNDECVLVAFECLLNYLESRHHHTSSTGNSESTEIVNNVKIISKYAKVILNFLEENFSRERLLEELLEWTLSSQTERINLFLPILLNLYREELLDVDDILNWFEKHSKMNQEYMKSIFVKCQSFINWLKKENEIDGEDDDEIDEDEEELSGSESSLSNLSDEDNGEISHEQTGTLYESKDTSEPTHISSEKIAHEQRKTSELPPVTTEQNEDSSDSGKQTEFGRKTSKVKLAVQRKEIPTRPSSTSSLTKPKESSVPFNSASPLIQLYYRHQSTQPVLHPYNSGSSTSSAHSFLFSQGNEKIQKDNRKKRSKKMVSFNDKTTFSSPTTDVS